jgi:uncharacterized protein (TIGR03000 family)
MGYTAALPTAEPAVVVARKPAVQPNRATVVVDLPADADLFVDGKRADLTSAKRTVVTPELKPGKEYFYTVKAEAVRDGKKVEKVRKVAFRAGSVVRLNLGDLKAAPDQTAAAAPSRVTVKLPEDARLYVDGVACPLTSGTRSFDTPKLEAGRSYYYTLKAEVVREGQTRSESKRVVVEAGKQVEVDFNVLAPVLTASR